jgi:hypothetical protein
MEKKERFVQGLAAILVRQGVLTEKEGESVQEEFRRNSADSFEYFLLDEGLVEKEPLLIALSEYYQLPAVDVPGIFFRQVPIHFFPKDIMLRYVFIPLEEDEDVLPVITSDPENEDLLPVISEYVSYEVSLRVGLRRDIEDAVKEFYDKPPTEEIPADVDAREERELEREEKAEIEEDENVADAEEIVTDEDKYFPKKADVQ